MPTSSGLTLPGQERRPDPRAWGGRSGQAGGRRPQRSGEQQTCREHLPPHQGHRHCTAPETWRVGSGVLTVSPEVTLYWPRPVPVLPWMLPPTPPSHLLVPHSAPRHASSQPHLQSAPSKRTWLDLLVTRHGTASPVIVAVTAAQADVSGQKPMQQGPAGRQQPSAFPHSGASTLTAALCHPALGATRPSDAQTAAVGLTSEPPRTPAVQSHTAPRHRQLPAAPGRVWAGAGAPRSPRCFSWEVLNLFLLTQPRGLSGRVLPNLRYVLEGCLAGPPSRQWWGSPLRTQATPPEPQPALCPRWGLSSDGGS